MIRPPGTARQSLMTVVATRRLPNTGLKVYCDVDHNAYPKGVAAGDDEMTALNIRGAEFHGQWNYSFLPA